MMTMIIVISDNDNNGNNNDDNNNVNNDNDDDDNKHNKMKMLTDNGDKSYAMLITTEKSIWSGMIRKRPSVRRILVSDLFAENLYAYILHINAWRTKIGKHVHLRIRIHVYICRE